MELPKLLNIQRICAFTRVLKNTVSHMKKDGAIHVLLLPVTSPQYFTQPLRPTQLPTLNRKENEYRPKYGDALRLGRKGRWLIPYVDKSSAVAEMGDRARAKWAEKWGLLCPFLWASWVPI